MDDRTLTRLESFEAAFDAGLRAALLPGPMRLPSAIVGAIVSRFLNRVSPRELARWDDDGGAAVSGDTGRHG
jgi:hypothetical protein